MIKGNLFETEVSNKFYSLIHTKFFFKFLVFLSYFFYFFQYFVLLLYNSLCLHVSIHLSFLFLTTYDINFQTFFFFFFFVQFSVLDESFLSLNMKAMW